MATIAERTREQTREKVDGRIRALSREEGRELFDRQARKLMNMSGDEFIRRWDVGEFDAIADDPEHPEIIRLAMLIPFGR